MEQRYLLWRLSVLYQYMEQLQHTLYIHIAFTERQGFVRAARQQQAKGQNGRIWMEQTRAIYIHYFWRNISGWMDAKTEQFRPISQVSRYPVPIQWPRQPASGWFLESRFIRQRRSIWPISCSARFYCSMRRWQRHWWSRSQIWKMHLPTDGRPWIKGPGRNCALVRQPNLYRQTAHRHLGMELRRF